MTTDTSQLDVHAAACLAGGTDRVVDTVLTVLVETGRVRVQRDGLLTVLDRRARDEVEAAVLDAIGTRGHRTAGLVRHRAGTDVRLTGLVDRLVAEGQLTARRRRRGSGPALTAAGRRSLRQLRAQPPARGAVAGTSAAAVALHGPARMPDAELRGALFESSRPVRLRRGLLPGRRRADVHGVAASAALYSSAPHSYGYGIGCGGGDSGGGHSCGGGGGCGGGGCGGGGG